MYAHMYVCMYIYTYVCKEICIGVYMYIFMFVCIVGCNEIEYGILNYWQLECILDVRKVIRRSPCSYNILCPD